MYNITLSDNFDACPEQIDDYPSRTILEERAQRCGITELELREFVRDGHIILDENLRNVSTLSHGRYCPVNISRIIAGIIF